MTTKDIPLLGSPPVYFRCTQVGTDANGNPVYMLGTVEDVADSGAATAVLQTAGNSSLASLLATAGATNGSAIITDANGTIQQYLRGLVKLAGTGIAAAPLNARSATYAVDAIGYAAYATPTDMIGIRGSATKTVVVTNLSIRANSTTATLVSAYCIKRSAANSGGTLTNPAGISYDSADAAPTAVVDVYTSAPTPGAPAGTLRILNFVTNLLTGTGAAAQMIAGNQYGAASSITLQKPITLHGVSEGLYINFNAAALPSGFTSAYSIEWIEY